ncbi:nucleotidyltransferase domain-containing protein [Sulfurisphaera javensis]|uniref:Nucleotidyltransferase domain-containing protein n=1 Tax=Sulfurisphaera javensis TaxID=2049879 RepID=A0AAT9GTT9_9CREN
MSDAWKDYSLLSDLLELYKKEEKEAKEYIASLCEKKKYTVILFGSRARGDNKIYSDWDLLVIGYEKPPLPWAEVDLHFIPVDKVKEAIKEFNTIVIDAFYEGKLICDDLSIYDELKKEVEKRIVGYKKTKEGWFREG